MNNITIRVQCDNLTETTEEELLFIVNKLLPKIDGVKSVSYVNEEELEKMRVTGELLESIIKNCKEIEQIYTEGQDRVNEQARVEILEQEIELKKQELDKWGYTFKPYSYFDYTCGSDIPKIKFVIDEMIDIVDKYFAYIDRISAKIWLLHSDKEDMFRELREIGISPELCGEKPCINKIEKTCKAGICKKYKGCTVCCYYCKENTEGNKCPNACYTAESERPFKCNALSIIKY